VSTIRCIHIAPELPPTVGGVADYTAILSQRLVEVSESAVEPVLVHAGNQSAETIEVDFPSVDLSGRCSATALAQAIERLAAEADGRAVVLLEYSGYGYAMRGAPLWLVRGLRCVCGPNGVPLVTIFHEISASGPVWTSAFWLAPVQTWCARQIAGGSDGLITTHPTGADQLASAVASDMRVEVGSVFSNVGEPDERPSFEERTPTAVIFGGGGTKTALYDTCRADTQSALDRWGIETVVDVGPPDAVDSDAFSTTVEVRGIQPAATISELLLSARIGVLQYPAAYATKSGILAAYMAHGVVPVLIDPKPLGGRLTAGMHFAIGAASVGDRLSDEGTRIAEAATAWYDENAHTRRTADRVWTLVKEALGRPSVASASRP
jgi:hypothetical protein